MLIWSTKIKAIDPLTGEMCIWGGPKIKAPSRKQAEEFCQENGLGYCEIDGLFITSLSDEGIEDNGTFNLN